MEDVTIKMVETEDIDDLINDVMNKYGQEILQLAFSYVNDKAIAEDLTQDIFVKCYKSLHSFNRKSAFRTWLWRIAINHCKDYLKSWYKKNVIMTEDELLHTWSQNKTVEETVIQHDEDQQLASAVMGLPVKYREVIHLYYFEEFPIKEIAIVLGVNVNTVKTRLKRAKELLKDRLGE